jgi:hypothetical protein
MPKRNLRRRRDRRAQIGVVLLAAVAGVVAGLLGTHRSWEPPPHGATPSTTASTPSLNP